MGTRGLSTRIGLGLLAGLSLFGCAQQDAATAAQPVEATRSALRPLTQDEALADFDELVGAFRSVYGALERKEQRYGFRFEELAASYRGRLQQAHSEPEYQAIGLEFISRFEDAHVGLVNSLDSDDSHAFSLPFLVTPIEDRFVVAAVRKQAPPGAATADAEAGWHPPPIARGDELISLDGVPASDLAKQLTKFAGIPNAQAAAHQAAALITQRPAYATSGIHAGDAARVRLRDARGAERELLVPWTETPHLLPPTKLPDSTSKVPSFNAVAVSAVNVIDLELQALGKTTPFFLTPQVSEKYGFSGPLGPSARALTKFGISEVSPDAAKLVYAANYSYKGARYLLVRLASYDVEDEKAADGLLAYLLALLDEQAASVDGIIFDETHNPGGSGYLAQNLVALLAQRPGNGLVQRMHGDRRWLQAYANAIEELSQQDSKKSAELAAQLQRDAAVIDAAYSSGEPLTAPLAFPGVPSTFEPPKQTWLKKPLLMLTDELSASAAEVTALLMQANHVAPLFGARTMGAGGNVEPVAYLANSQIALALSRGVFTVYDPTGEYPESRYVEDQGVTPDLQYAHTLPDFRAGYVGYVEAFSEALGKLIAQGE